MKKLGIIGGLGPMATAYLMEQIIKMTDASCDQEHIEMTIFNVPSVPDRTSYILGHSTKSPLLQLKQIALDLQKNDCDILAMPCITAHYFHNELENAINIPLIHGIKECGKYLAEHGIHTIGLMATDGTVESKLFSECLKDFNITVIYPDAVHQQYVMDIIYKNVKASLPIDMDKFNAVSKHLFSQNAQLILLGCTELSIIKRDMELSHNYLDVIDIIAQKAVISCGKLKEEYKELIT